MVDDETKKERVGQILSDPKLRENPEQFLSSLSLDDLKLLIEVFNYGIERLNEKVRNYLGLPRKKST